MTALSPKFFEEFYQTLKTFIQVSLGAQNCFENHSQMHPRSALVYSVNRPPPMATERLFSPAYLLVVGLSCLCSS